MNHLSEVHRVVFGRTDYPPNCDILTCGRAAFKVSYLNFQLTNRENLRPWGSHGNRFYTELTQSVMTEVTDRLNPAFDAVRSR
jgi:hypothetical protein